MAKLHTPTDTDLTPTSRRTPAVTIGMPVFNGASYIRDALDSLLAQTFTDFELIISDNSSTDATHEICNTYVRKDPRIRYIRQPENKGASENFKFVLGDARADLFMWAAYDDLWAKSYLMNAVSLLAANDVDFVFPAFELRSIRLRIAKTFDPEIFKFIESTDRRQRVLQFLALHYLSHSANIVYSLFRTGFLREAWKTQGISNDGALGAVALSRGRGVVSGALFSKRYRSIWPGMLPASIRILNGWFHNRSVTHEARRAIEAAKVHLLGLFPEFEREIVFIFERYHPHSYDRNFQVCSIRELF